MMRKVSGGAFRLFAGCALFAGAALAAPHVVEIKGPTLSPDEGLLLGNGDLSCSVYQTSDHLVFRLGKGDVWDRRLDFTGVPKPAHIQEFIDGELKEGWKSNPFDGNATEATKGTKNPTRMKELCGGKSTQVYPYPLPKPTGEFRVKLPVDMPGPMETVQRLVIEEGRLMVGFRWKNGVTLKVEAVIPYDENVLAVKWDLAGWDAWTRIGQDGGFCPVWFALTRWADPPFPGWCAALVTDHDTWAYDRSGRTHANLKTLPPPTAFMDGAVGCVEQAFYPDNLFKDGFRCRLSLLADPEKTGRVRTLDVAYGTKDAWVVCKPSKSKFSGEVAVAVTTSRDAALKAPKAKTFAEYKAATLAAAREDWAKRGFSFPSDPELETQWYATCHARRCVLRGGTVPPGLFFPSTIGDYCYWHGDYHSNYNMEAIYWGAFNGNQMEQMAAYFDCVDFYRPIGEKIARDYYGCRGCFVQLEGFPLLGDDDHHGSLPLGRMAYMTGWFMEPYWKWYRYTLDKEFLAKRGYPFIRDCALFYLDFLKKAPDPNLPPELKDGKYHVFPSIQGESGFSGNPMDVCDKGQAVMHARYCLYAAILAAKELGVDEELRAQWKERLDNLVNTPRKFDGPNAELRYHCWITAEPEIGGREYWPPKAWDGKAKCPENGSGFAGADYWYYGIGAMWRCGGMRRSDVVPERDFPFWRKRLAKWTNPNGLVRAMAVAHYGRAGAWTETLSCMAPMEEMLLQSWDGSLRIFPCWRGADIAFADWRAEGAFLVSGEYRDGKVASVTVKSEKGAPCVLTGAWDVADADGKPVACDRDEFGRLRFQTVAGATYRLAPSDAANGKGR